MALHLQELSLCSSASSRPICSSTKLVLVAAVGVCSLAITKFTESGIQLNISTKCPVPTSGTVVTV